MASSVSRLTLSIINLFTLLIGLVGIGLGIYGLYAGSYIHHLISLGMPTVILLEGLLVTGVSGIGLYASVKEEHNLLRYYFGLLLMLLFIQVMVSSVTMARRGDADFYLYEAWDKAYWSDRPFLERVEKTNSCCGFSTLKDRAVPEECSKDPEFGFTSACRDKLSIPIKRILYDLGMTGFVLSGLEALALTMLLILYSDILKESGRFLSRDNDLEEARRLDEARRLLREGEIPATQVYPGGKERSV